MDHNTTAKLFKFLRPGAAWMIRDREEGGFDVIWLDKVQTQPTAIELEAAFARLSVFDYRELRHDEYPPIADQLDAMWKGGQAAADMLEQIKAVKAKYPKGE